MIDRTVDAGLRRRAAVHAALGEPGEIWTRGPDQFAGYMDETENAQAFSAANQMLQETANLLR